MELIFPLIIVAVVVFLIIKVFSRKKKRNEPDKYMVVQRRETRVTNHVVKVPKKKR